jgi:hypothetical protein
MVCVNLGEGLLDLFTYYPDPFLVLPVESIAVYTVYVSPLARSLGH